MISAMVWRYDSIFVPARLTDLDNTGTTEGNRSGRGEDATMLGVLLS
jgi:hypothetical protein